jgi:hypothetical protein
VEENTMHKTLAVLSIAAALACPAVTAAAELRISGNDSVQTVLTAQKGARVTVRVRSGQDITGVVRDVNARVVQIGAVSGREFFDAVVPLEAVDAVFVRTKDQ